MQTKTRKNKKKHWLYNHNLHLHATYKPAGATYTLLLCYQPINFKQVYRFEWCCTNWKCNFK